MVVCWFLNFSTNLNRWWFVGFKFNKNPKPMVVHWFFLIFKKKPKPIVVCWFLSFQKTWTQAGSIDFKFSKKAWNRSWWFVAFRFSKTLK
jgi:hypothetical protein